MIETPQQYTERLLSLAGMRDPLDVLSTTAARIGRTIAGRSDADLRRTPDPGRWSAAAIITHLADAEVVANYRFRMVLAHPGTALQPFDQNEWASAFDYQNRDAFSSLAAFAALRTMTLHLLDGLDESRLEYYGLHEERGRESVRHMMRLYAGHDLNHLGQIDALLARPAAVREPSLPALRPATVKPVVDPELLNQLDIRVGTILSVSDVRGATRLAALTVDFGDHRRQIVAGIRQERAHPQLLVGQQALFVVNIPPRTIHGEVSDGMLFDAGHADGIRPALAKPEWPVPDGTRAG